MKSPILSCVIVLAVSLGALNAANADSATWNLNPNSGDWNTAANWTPATVPNGPDDVATFSLSNQTSVSIFGVEIELSSLVFDPGASAFTIAFTVNLPLTGLTFSGIGIVNNSGVLQTFVCDLGTITFTQNATAGELIAYTKVYGMDFRDNASAGNCTFTREGNMAGLINFYDNSTADHATFTNNPGYGSAVIFYGNSTARATRPSPTKEVTTTSIRVLLRSLIPPPRRMDSSSPMVPLLIITDTVSCVFGIVRKRVTEPLSPTGGR